MSLGIRRIAITGVLPLPLMSTFRHPASIKLFTIFFGCILQHGACMLLASTRQYQRKLKKAALVSLIILAILFLSALTGGMGILENSVRCC